MRLLIRQECYANQPSEWAESQCPSLRLLLGLLVFFVSQLYTASLIHRNLHGLLWRSHECWNVSMCQDNRTRWRELARHFARRWSCPMHRSHAVFYPPNPTHPCVSPGIYFEPPVQSWNGSLCRIDMGGLGMNGCRLNIWECESNDQFLPISSLRICIKHPRVRLETYVRTIVTSTPIELTKLGLQHETCDGSCHWFLAANLFRGFEPTEYEGFRPPVEL